MSLIDKLNKLKGTGKKILLGSTLLGSLVYSSGCTVNDKTAAGAGLGAVGIYKGGVAGAAAQWIGGALIQEGSAEAGRSQVNVNVNNVGNRSLQHNTSQMFPEGIPLYRQEGITTYREYNGDLNGDGIFEKCLLVNFGEDYINRASSNYDFGFRIVANNQLGKIIDFSILRKEDLEVIEKQRFLVDNQSYNKHISISGNSGLKIHENLFIAKKLEKGNYYGKVEIDGITIDIQEIRLFP